LARTVRNSALDTRTARSRLARSGVPHWCGLDQGLHLGYRKGKKGGKWVMRWRAADVYRVETIGTADDIADADGVAILNFGEAQAIAREKRVALERTAKGLSADGGPYTVKVCLDEYLRYLETERKSAGDAQARIDALILPTLGDTVLFQPNHGRYYGLVGADGRDPSAGTHEKGRSPATPRSRPD